MRAGTLNTLVLIQARGEAVDEIGQPLPDAWVTVAKAWANVRHQSGSEAIRAGAPVSSVQASIRIRYRRDISATMRVIHGATVYEIHAVLPDEARREHVDLVCEAVR